MQSTYESLDQKIMRRIKTNKYGGLIEFDVNGTEIKDPLAYCATTANEASRSELMGKLAGIYFDYYFCNNEHFIVCDSLDVYFELRDEVTDHGCPLSPSFIESESKYIMPIALGMALYATDSDVEVKHKQVGSK